ncbi:tetratricopeptide repeat protein [Streptomyces sp. NPDC050085]|uniref:tetratricopeptide repeat protein n=1 Tax=Streptomyces sp. NPDC050085 TaxID=3365600 RepID=UPI00378CB0A0
MDTDSAHSNYHAAERAYAAGRYAQALPLFRQAVAELEALHGPEHDLVLQAQVDQGITLFNLGRYPDAETVQRRALEGRLRTVGADHGATLHTRARLAESVGYQGRWEEAEALAQETIARGQARGRGAHTAVISARLTLAWIRRHQENWPEAIEGARTVLEMCQGQRDVTHDAMAARCLLVRCLLAADDLDEAEQQAVAVRELRHRHLGAEHPYTLSSSIDLARVLHAAGRHTDSRPLAENLLPAAERVLGTGHTDTLQLRALLAA